MTPLPHPDRWGGVENDDDVRHHVERPSPPWRVEKITECGLDVAKRPVTTRDQFLQKLEKLGSTRMAMVTCMTCWQTASRWPSWEEDPVESISREVSGGRGWPSSKKKLVFRHELLAIAALVERHRAEFDELMQDQAEIVNIKGGRE